MRARFCKLSAVVWRRVVWEEGGEHQVQDTMYNAGEDWVPK